MAAPEKRRGASRPPARAPRPGRVPLGAALLAAGALVFALGWWHWSGGLRSGSGPAPEPVIPDQAATYARYAGSHTCLECHAEAHAEWAPSNHGQAERPLDARRDRTAFDPPRHFFHGSQSTEVRFVDGRYELVTVGFNSNREPYQVVRVIGHYPLRQYLVPRPGGRFQVSEAAWDPATNEWFNVYGAEDRLPGEWGHWTGRGMGWNAMCAGCHNTRVRKNYDELTDTYRTAMVEPTVSCEACHGPMRDHVLWQRTHRNTSQPDPTLTPFSPHQLLGMCGSCHARRGDLTGDFQPYDDFFDHYSLTIPDETDIYHPDGQVRDENFEFAAFLGSTMQHRGVTCLDCHPPHRSKPAITGNDLCMRCHNGSRDDSPLIDPVAHGFHATFSGGNDCVDCHMPQTLYMERHWRRDHGFTIPDPLLTLEFGIPNACNRCHQDQDAAWALAHVEAWYGDRMQRRTRTRAQWIARARQRDPAAREPLLKLLAEEELPYWRASIISLLEPWIHLPDAARAVRDHLDHPHPLVRENAVRTLAPLLEFPDSPLAPAFRQLLDDPRRNVRVAAAWALRAELDPADRAGRELLHMLDYNADQPTGQLQKGVFALARGLPEDAHAHLRKAVNWDPNSAPLRHELAVLCSLTGRARDAVDHLEAACRLEPGQAEYRYKLALAWNELGNLSQTISHLEAAVRIDPQHARAWYNLGIARQQNRQPDLALEAYLRAETAQPDDARIPHARATLLQQLGRSNEARLAADRAAALDREGTLARQTLRAILSTP